jgi:PAS domain-containing protein
MPQSIRMVQPLTIPGRGAAILELAAPVRYSWIAGWEAQTGLGVIGLCGSIAVLAVYRRLRRNLRALGAIREALIALQNGESASAALTVSSAFGAEAEAWNRLLHEREQLTRDLAGERARESLGSRRDLKADLAQACDALPQGLVLVDDRLNVKYANGAAAIFLRAKRESLPGTSIQDHVKDPEVLESLRAVAGGGVRRRAIVEVSRPESRISPSSGSRTRPATPSWPRRRTNCGPP